MTTTPIKVLVVDDSAFLRKVISEMLAASPQIEVVGTAYNGIDGLEKAEALQPDVITLDLYMPVLDGLGFLKEQMKRHPLPVVVCTVAGEDNNQVIAALEAGAFDLVQKPTQLANESLYEISQRLVQKVLEAGRVEPQHLLRAEPLLDRLAVPVKKRLADRFDAVLLGISTGGPQALRYLLPRLPANFPVAMAVVLHMPVGYTGPFAERLNEICALEILEARAEMEMKPGRVILAQAGYHLVLKRDPHGVVRACLELEPLNEIHRPSVNVLFQTGAEVYGARTLGVVMTGMGNDGTAGAAWIKAQNGFVIAEAEESAIVYGMPRSVVEKGLADRISPLEKMAETLLEVT